MRTRTVFVITCKGKKYTHTVVLCIVGEIKKKILGIVRRKQLVVVVVVVVVAVTVAAFSASSTVASCMLEIFLLRIHHLNVLPSRYCECGRLVYPECGGNAGDLLALVGQVQLEGGPPGITEGQ